jgi:hypothetical protein
MSSSGMWHPVDLVTTDVSEERVASVFRVEKIRERSVGTSYMSDIRHTTIASQETSAKYHFG